MANDLSIKILVADDMPTMRNIIERMLKGLGYENVSTFEDGQLAYDDLVKMQAEGTPYHLVISDWNMPVLNGLNFLIKVRATEGMNNIPFLMVTTISDKSKVIEALNHGVSHYVMKPLTVDDLELKIDKILLKHAS